MHGRYWILLKSVHVPRWYHYSWSEMSVISQFRCPRTRSAHSRGSPVGWMTFGRGVSPIVSSASQEPPSQLPPSQAAHRSPPSQAATPLPDHIFSAAFGGLPPSQLPPSQACLRQLTPLPSGLGGGYTPLPRILWCPQTLIHCRVLWI